MFDGFWDFLKSLWGGLSYVLKAVLLLILAFIVATIVKKIVISLLNKFKLDEKLSRGNKNAGGTSLTEFIGKLVFLLVFLLFVPGIFSALGVDSVAAPILGMMSAIWGYIPNILGAAIVLVVGFLIARLVRELLIPVFEKIKLDKLQEKTGVEVPDSSKLSRTLAYIIYVLILIPVIIIALQVLQISAISEPAINMLNIIFAFIPNIIVAALIIFIGVILANFASQIVSRLIGATGVDAKLQDYMGEKFKNFELSKCIGTVVKVVIIIFFVVESFSILQLGVLTRIGTAIIGYMPSVLAAVLIFVAAMFAGGFVEKALKKAGYAFYGLLAKIALTVFAIFMILNQLRIADEIVRIAFILILGALAVAFAIAFGIGGREFAADVLKDLKDRTDKMREEAEAIKAKEAEEPAPEEVVEEAEEKVEKTIDEELDEESAFSAAVDDKADAAEEKIGAAADKLTDKIKGFFHRNKEE